MPFAGAPTAARPARGMPGWPRWQSPPGLAKGSRTPVVPCHGCVAEVPTTTLRTSRPTSFPCHVTLLSLMHHRLPSKQAAERRENSGQNHGSPELSGHAQGDRHHDRRLLDASPPCAHARRGWPSILSPPAQMRWRKQGQERLSTTVAEARYNVQPQLADHHPSECLLSLL